ncbi:YciI family protein [Dactylosporangium sp. AC04546]|uniref:YciI family protein n=1 Tax=Dactylosporangium sp. AC04546 TaxID=2862460 RepID=UPI001EDE0BBB|nr:YciI family protein [Dactylosporangium sp. AC04546]WVK80595.1 YciI family protein [Dactylosporangium sp. AC04546]
MRYLCLLYVAEDKLPQPGTADFDEMVAGNIAANKAMAEAGVLVDSAPLHPVHSASTLRLRDGAALISDGPYAELHEQLGGYYLVDCADLDEALRWAKLIPAANYGTVEIRPVVDMGPHR